MVLGWISVLSVLIRVVPPMVQSGTGLYLAISIEVLPLSKKNNKTYHGGSIPQKMQNDLAHEISSKC